MYFYFINEDGNVIPGAWRDDVQMTEPNQMIGRRASKEGKTLRNYLANCYSFPLGSLPWQDRIVKKKRTDTHVLINYGTLHELKIYLLYFGMLLC